MVHKPALAAGIARRVDGFFVKLIEPLGIGEAALFFRVTCGGEKKTSVSMPSGFSSPLRTSGESYQKEAVSVSTISRTTSHFSLAKALRSRPEFGAPTAGFCPMTNRPSTFPSAISNQ